MKLFILLRDAFYQHQNIHLSRYDAFIHHIDNHAKPKKKICFHIFKKMEPMEGHSETIADNVTPLKCQKKSTNKSIVSKELLNRLKKHGT